MPSVTARSSGSSTSLSLPNSGRHSLVVIILRRLLFATCILFGLAFAVICYAEMLGVVQYD